MSSAVCLLLSAHVCQFELELGRTRAYPMQTGGSGYSRVEYLHRRPHMGGGRGTSIHIPAPVAGLGLAAGASMLLWWNEKRTAETERMLREARAELSGRRRGGGGSRGGGGLQYWAGALNSADGVADDIFPEVHRRAAKLRRLTEVYQWHEHERVSETRVGSQTVRRTTQVSYDLRWSADSIDSHFFKERSHFNPRPRVAAGALEEVVADATLTLRGGWREGRGDDDYQEDSKQVREGGRGRVRVPAELVDQLDGWRPVPLRVDGASRSSRHFKAGKSGWVEEVRATSYPTPYPPP